MGWRLITMAIKAWKDSEPTQEEMNKMFAPVPMNREARRGYRKQYTTGKRTVQTYIYNSTH